MLGVLMLVVNVGFVEISREVSANLAFGRSQVEQIIMDRPSIEKTLVENPQFRRELERLFAGGLTGSRIYWDCREPISGLPAEHGFPYPGHPTMICVSRYVYDGRDLCAMIFFEINNYEIDGEYNALLAQAPNPRKTRKEFAISCTEKEFNAAKKTQAYFLENPLIGDDSANLSLYGSLGEYGTFKEYIAWLDELGPNDYDPRRYHGTVYNQIVAFRSKPSATRQVMDQILRPQ